MDFQLARFKDGQDCASLSDNGSENTSRYVGENHDHLRCRIANFVVELQYADGKASLYQAEVREIQKRFKCTSL